LIPFAIASSNCWWQSASQAGDAFVSRMPNSCRIDPKRKRWASCASCSGCLATDCGECINCMDKSKFGGQGVRKQSCIKRRCARMNSNASASSSTATSRGDDGEPSSQVRKTESEQALFWAAVSGCMALHEQPGSDDETATAPRGGFGGGDAPPGGSDSDSCPRSPGGSVDSDYTSRREREPYEGPAAPWRSSLTAASSSSLSCPHTGPESFCNKLASVLASDKRLASQPVGLRALRRAGILESNSPSVTPALASALSSSLADPSLANQLRNGLDELLVPTIAKDEIVPADPPTAQVA